MKSLLVLAVLLVPGVALGGHRVRVACVQRQAVVANAVVLQQYPQYPQQMYQVGQSVQSDAIAEAIASKVLAKLNAQLAANAQANVSAAPGVQALEEVPLTMLTKTCASCHSGPTAPKHLDLTNLAALTCEQKLAAIGRIVRDEMPPAKDKQGRAIPRLGGEEAAALINELSK